MPSAKISVRIQIQALPGQADVVAQLLSGAAEVVKNTEPQTLYWYATREGDTFTINDGFADESGLNAHFNGEVAAALKSKAEATLVGGWEKGVLPNIVRSDILSII